MKPKPPKAKRTLADFIRGDAASPDLNGVEDNGDVLEVGIEKLVEGRQADVESANGESGGSGQAHRELSGRELAGGELKRSRQGGGDQADGGGSASGLVEAKENPAEAFLEAIAGLGDFQSAVGRWVSGKPFYWEGAWGGAVAPLVCAVRRKVGRPLLVLVAHHQEAESTARDIEFFSQEESLVFPPGSEDVPDDAFEQQEMIDRLQVLARLDRYNADLATKKPSAKNPSAKKSVAKGASSKSEIIQAAKGSGVPVVVATMQSIMQCVPSPEQLRSDRKTIMVGGTLDLREFKEWLESVGYRSTTSVRMVGEYTARGGILDVYPPDVAEPYRIELFDNEIESIRTFDTVTQRSIQRAERVDLISAKDVAREEGTLLDYLPSDTMVLFSEPTAGMHQAMLFQARVPFPERFRDPQELLAKLQQGAYADIGQLAIEGYPWDSVRIPIGDVQRIGGELERISNEIDQTLVGDRRAVVVCINAGELSRMQEILAGSAAYTSGRIRLVEGMLSAGFEIPAGAFILTVNQILRRTMLKRSGRKHASKAIDSFLDLKEGDLVVHLSHGIGIYLGMEMIAKEGQKYEHLVIEFDEGAKLYVPASKIDFVQRYVGGTKTRPRLAKIGGQAWAKQKKAAESAVEDMAADLLDLQAQRRSLKGITFHADSVWQHQFEGSFPYEETVDQLTAIEATKKDMESSRPMERLICGDVGFGKTEVAMRAAFKAVESGYQVAVLVPTTVLAEQHAKTFKQRMAEFPFEIAKLSRFDTAAKQSKILAKLAKGQVDIIVGTHRLASSDVKFFNLGLLIIDEEQKFGVELKERIKKTATQVDVLTLSATPIPRTLHMSLVGIRDISNLVTAPEERMAVETRVVRWNDKLIRNAVLRELNRDGQVYFVHNRISDMHAVAAKLQRIVPEARVAIGHGQMAENELERVMMDFIEHRVDVLLATTIIESGLDISNANTIFIDEADRYGLSELHQLRGRVGRYIHQAHCYLLVDSNKHLNPDAARRLHAIEEFSQLGAGFGIAMRDLEIRGAGNLLGTQQSGHIAAVGYELYCQMLDNAVRQLTKLPPKFSLDVDIQIPIEAYLPSEYIPDMRQKIDVYRRISRLQDIQSIETIRQELRDRFGEVPASVERLLRLAELRMDATLWTVRSVDIQERFLRLQYSDGKRIAHLSKLHGGKLRIVESEQSAYWPLWEVLTARTDSRMDPRMDVRRDASMGSRMGSRMDQRSNQGGSVRPKEELSDKERLARIDLLAVLKEVLRY
jgi:transcription-repair coupling factor (superfamily II helicase)